MRKHKVYLLDFNDSFTYNIAEQIYRSTTYMEVVKKSDIEKLLGHYISHKNKGKQKNIAFVIGPGPGHPNDYCRIVHLVNNLIKIPQYYFQGICLGHQMIWQCLGFSIEKARRPSHGQKEKITIPKWSGVFPLALAGKSTMVQRYNSLAVKRKRLIRPLGVRSYFQEDEIMMSAFSNGFSMQFHPESIGTSYPNLFFHPLLQFLYNGTYGKSFENRWDL